MLVEHGVRRGSSGRIECEEMVVVVQNLGSQGGRETKDEFDS